MCRDYLKADSANRIHFFSNSIDENKKIYFKWHNLRENRMRNDVPLPICSFSIAICFYVNLFAYYTRFAAENFKKNFAAFAHNASPNKFVIIQFFKCVGGIMSVYFSLYSKDILFAQSRHLSHRSRHRNVMRH